MKKRSGMGILPVVDGLARCALAIIIPVVLGNSDNQLVSLSLDAFRLALRKLCVDYLTDIGIRLFECAWIR